MTEDTRVRVQTIVNVAVAAQDLLDELMVPICSMACGSGSASRRGWRSC